ncbi:hypothetical protein [Aquimarina litoralis]|uniref:hypothetical protein n=1 Tax=Aquimarina litoralis TaxID=584605 RepID=UPI001C58C011|nr:hypothetical protein [Aquimarina litoralis]MBW1296728.1 hypothetical protein [Aquimarina litoralis]
MTTKLTYQWSYIIIATMISTIVLFYYTKELPELIANDRLSKEITMCSGQLVWQGGIILLFIKRKIHTYLCHMITVSLLGSLALIPLLLLYKVTLIDLEVKIFLFLLVVSIMIIEHARRVKKLQLPSYLTVTWMLYRIAWLPILLY